MLLPDAKIKRVRIGSHRRVQSIIQERSLSGRQSFKANRAAAITELQQLCAARRRVGLEELRRVRIGINVTLAGSQTKGADAHRHLPTLKLLDELEPYAAAGLIANAFNFKFGIYFTVAVC